MAAAVMPSSAAQRRYLEFRDWGTPMEERVPKTLFALVARFAVVLTISAIASFVSDFYSGDSHLPRGL